MATGIDVVDAEADRIMVTVDHNIRAATLTVLFDCWGFLIQVDRAPGSVQPIYRLLMYERDRYNDPAPRMVYGPSLEALLDRVLPQLFMGVMP
jgi:hypothetical protein